MALPSDSPFDSKESLSAVMDGMAHELEMRRVLQACATDPALRQQWLRYQAVSAALHKEVLPQSQSLQFADAVQRAIADDAVSATKVPSRKAGTSWSRALSKVAVAASVALAVVIVAQWQQDQDGVGGSQLAQVVPVKAARPATTAGEAPLEAVSAIAPVAGSIFAQPSRDLSWARLPLQRNIENAALDTRGNKVPLIRAAEQAGTSR